MDIIPSIATALHRVKSMTNILKAFDGLRISTEISNATAQLRDHIIALQSSLIDTQAHQYALIS